MSHLSDEALREYCKDLTPEQEETARALRSLILRVDPTVREYLDDNEPQGFLKYDSHIGNLVYAIGPKRGNFTVLHAVPYYCSQPLQNEFRSILKPVISGKTSFDFKLRSHLPVNILMTIMKNGSTVVDEAMKKRK